MCLVLCVFVSFVMVVRWMICLIFCCVVLGILLYGVLEVVFSVGTFTLVCRDQPVVVQAVSLLNFRAVALQSVNTPCSRI